MAENPDQDTRWMRRALRLAERGRGAVEPNPVVGCVIVRGDQVVGEGYHRKFGGPHAEVEALRRAGGKARGATAYVTLEPCCHTGKTPPCTEALLAARVKRVVIACEDPFDRVAGRGMAALKDAGIAVDVGICAAEAELSHAPFFKRVRTGLPYVIAKWAMTADGAIATHTGDSRWISGDGSRRWVHRLRGRVDAVLVGIGTVLADDPMLTARDVPRRRIARRVVIDPSLRTPPTCAMVRSNEEAPVTIFASRAAAASREKRLAALGIEVVRFGQRADGGLDLRAGLKFLAKVHEATNILCEGGGRTIGRLIEQRLADEAVVFIAPKVLGDERAIHPASFASAAKTIRSAVSLKVLQMRRIDDDWMIRYQFSQ